MSRLWYVMPGIVINGALCAWNLYEHDWLAAVFPGVVSAVTMGIGYVLYQGQRTTDKISRLVEDDLDNWGRRWR